VEQQDVPKEEPALKTIGALKDQYSGRRQPKKGTQGDGGSWQKLDAARGQLIRRAISAPRNGHGRQRLGKKRVRGARKGATFGKRRRTKPESNSGVRHRPKRAATSKKQ
jgi:hypothetical protein